MAQNTPLPPPPIKTPVLQNDFVSFPWANWFEQIYRVTGDASTLLTATAPLIFNNSTRVLAMPKATTTVDGYLSAIDWTTFNTKEPAISFGTTAQFWRGDKTWQAINVIAEPPITAGTTAQYWRGDKAWQTLNQAAVAGLTIADSPVFVTVKLSGLTDGYVPYHVADATGLADSPMRISGGLVGIGVVPTYLMDIYSTGAPTNKIFALADSGVAHGMTTIEETTVYASARYSNPSYGGLLLRGLATSTIEGMRLESYSGCATPDISGFTIRAYKKNGTGVTDIGATDYLCDWYNNGTSKLRLLGSGALSTVNQFISTVANGTKPIDVTSQTVCTNLNSDFLDGQHGSYYWPAQTGTEFNVPVWDTVSTFGASKLYNTSTGVGVNTLSPVSMLEVYSATAATVLTISANNGSSNSLPQIQFRNTANESLQTMAAIGVDGAAFKIAVGVALSSGQFVFTTGMGIGCTAGTSIPLDVLYAGGYGTTPAGLRIQSNSATRFEMQSSSADAQGLAGVLWRRSRGTIASKTAILNGDYIGRFDFFGHDGTDQETYAATMLVRCINTVGTNVVPGEFQFWCAPATGADGITQSTFIDAIGLRVGREYDLSTYCNRTLKIFTPDDNAGTAAVQSLQFWDGAGAYDGKYGWTFGFNTSASGNFTLRNWFNSASADYITCKWNNGGVWINQNLYVNHIGEVGSSHGIVCDNSLGIGVTPAAFLHVLGTTEQLRLGYDATHYLSTTISAAGSCAFALNTAAQTYSFDKAVGIGAVPTNEKLEVHGDGAGIRVKDTGANGDNGGYIIGIDKDGHEKWFMGTSDFDVFRNERFGIGAIENVAMDIATNNIVRMSISAAGAVKIAALAGTGSRTVVAAADGTLSAP